MVFSHIWRSLAHIMVVVIFVILLSSCSPQRSDLSETASENSTPLPVLKPTINVSVTSITEETTASATTEPEPDSPAIPEKTETIILFDGIPQGQTIDGFPFLGNPDAPVTLVDYSDFL